MRKLEFYSMPKLVRYANRDDRNVIAAESSRAGDTIPGCQVRIVKLRFKGLAAGSKRDSRRSSRVNGVDVLNVLQQKLAPAVFNGAGAVVPKANNSTEAIPDEELSDLNW